jgi:antitoxin YefM
VSLQETAHLLRSPENAQRLISALAKARRGEGKIATVEGFRKEMGLE